MQVPFQVTYLGTGSANSFPDRYPTSQVLQIRNRFVLIDCGEGAQFQLRRFKIPHARISQIFISHLHGDHFFGLPGLLTSYWLENRTTPLEIYGPEGLEHLMRTLCLQPGQAGFSYPLTFHVVDHQLPQLLYEDDLYTVHSLPLNHRIPTTGYVFREKPKPRNLKPKHDYPANVDIDFSIEQIKNLKASQDIVLPNGQIIPHEAVTTPPALSGSYAFCSDTMYNPSLIPLLQNVHTLYHEATFTNEAEARALATGHSTAGQAAGIARQAGVQQLVLGHISNRYDNLELLQQQAQEVFPNVLLSSDGLQLTIA